MEFGKPKKTKPVSKSSSKLWSEDTCNLLLLTYVHKYVVLRPPLLGVRDIIVQTKDTIKRGAALDDATIAELYKILTCTIFDLW